MSTECDTLLNFGIPAHSCRSRGRRDSAGDGERKVIGLVGKGLTFDSGGYNLKVGGAASSLTFAKSLNPNTQTLIPER